MISFRHLRIWFCGWDKLLDSFGIFGGEARAATSSERACCGLSFDLDSPLDMDEI
jgi:hypothetical protein